MAFDEPLGNAYSAYDRTVRRAKSGGKRKK